MRAITYRRVSTREQGESGLGLDAQAAALASTIEAKGWEHVADFHDVSTGKKRNGRHGLERALEMLERGDADVLAVAKLDRLARSVVDFGKIVKQSKEQGWALKVLDPDVDTSTASGRLCANVLIAVSEWEGDIISERTRAGLAQSKKQLGGRKVVPDEVRERIAAMRADGTTLQAIANTLNDEGVATGKGGAQWYPSTVRAALKVGTVELDRRGRRKDGQLRGADKFSDAAFDCGDMVLHEGKRRRVRSIAKPQDGSEYIYEVEPTSGKGKRTIARESALQGV